MIKKLLIMFIFLLFLPFVYAAGDISVSSSSLSDANSGDDVTATLTLDNAGADDLRVNLPTPLDLTGTNMNMSLGVTYDVAELVYIDVAASSQEIFNYSFSVPSDAYAGAYNGVLNFTTNSTTDYDELDLALTVLEDHDVTVNNITLDIAQGQTGTATLTLTNDGNMDETASLPASVTLISTTNAANTLTASILQTSLDVDYKGANSTTVTVDVPADAALETYELNMPINYGPIVYSLTTVNVVAPSYSVNAGSLVFPLTDPNSTVSTRFLVENTGNSVLDNLVLSSNLASKYSLTFNETAAFSLGIGESRFFEASVFVPYREAIGNHTIGTATVSGDNNFTSSYNVFVDVEAKLDIEDLDILIDDDTSSNVENGEKIEDKAKPDSEVELKIRLKNTFSEESDIEISDITITATLIDPDDEDIDEVDVDVSDLDADEKSDEDSITFKLPLDVEEGDYTIEIDVEGEDENGVRHSLDWTVYFKLEKKSHEIMIYKAYLTPEKVKCTRTSSLYVKLMNIGSKTEDEVRLTISNSDLEINIDKRDLELSKNPDDDDNTHKEEIIVDATDKEAKSYPITIKAYYNEDLLDDVKTVYLLVEDCSPEPKKDDTTVIVQEPVQNVTIPVSGEEIPTTTETSFMDSTSGVVLLLLGNVVVLVVVIFFITKVFLVPKIPKP